MPARARPNWAVFVGGPLNGQRHVLPPQQGVGLLRMHTPGPARGTRVPHEYRLTEQRRPGAFHEAAARVAEYVRTLPEEPPPPETVGYGPSTAGFGPSLEVKRSAQSPIQ